MSETGSEEELLWQNIENIEVFENLYDNYLNSKLVTLPLSSTSIDRIKNIRVDFINGTKVNYGKKTTKRFIDAITKNDDFRNKIARIDIKFDFSKVKFDSYVLSCALNEKWFSN